MNKTIIIININIKYNGNRIFQLNIKIKNQ